MRGRETTGGGRAAERTRLRERIEALRRDLEAAEAQLYALAPHKPRLGRPPAGRKEPPRELSPRQTEVLRLIALGSINRAIARELGISEKTVECHRAAIKRRIGARGAGDLVRHAVGAGLVDTAVKLSDRALTERETAVLRCLGAGMPNASAALKLEISVKTVEAHRANIQRKLGAKRLADLVRYAIARGLA